MFIVTWLFDKLGYIPKISVDCWVSQPLQIKTLSQDLEIPNTKPKVAKKPAVKRVSTRKPKVKK